MHTAQIKPKSPLGELKVSDCKELIRGNKELIFNPIMSY